MKKTKTAAAVAVDQAEAQTSAPATEEAAVEQPIAEQATAEPTTSEQAGDPAAENAAGTEQKPVRGRALVDLPAYDLKCGEFGSLPYETARALWATGYFDPSAIEP